MIKTGGLWGSRIRSDDEQIGDKPIAVANPTAEDDQPADAAKAARRHGGTARWIQRRRAPLVIGLQAVLVAVSVALASWMYLFESRPDHQIGRAAENAALTAATTGSIALLSYSPDSLDRDLASAKSHLTGDFLTYYTHFSDQVVAPAAKQKSVKTTAQIKKAAVSQMHPDVAAALLFINQTTTSSDHPEPWVETSSVLVTVNKVNGNWLIAKFEPV
jgi:Mce-associated membrane protein